MHRENNQVKLPLIVKTGQLRLREVKSLTQSAPANAEVGLAPGPAALHCGPGFPLQSCVL